MHVALLLPRPNQTDADPSCLASLTAASRRVSMYAARSLMWTPLAVFWLPPSIRIRGSLMSPCDTFRTNLSVLRWEEVVGDDLVDGDDEHAVLGHQKKDGIHADVRRSLETNGSCQDRK